MKTVRILLLFACMLSLIGICASAEDPTDDMTEGTTADVAYTVTAASGEVTEGTDPSNAALKNAIRAAKSGALVTLYRDYTLEKTTEYLAFTKNMSLDLNGHTLRADCEFSQGAVRGAAQMSLYVYSSVPGGKIVSEGAKSFFYVAGTAVVGKNAAGEHFARENLTIESRSVATIAKNGSFSLSYVDVYCGEGSPTGTSSAVFAADKVRAACEAEGCRLFLTGADTVFEGGSYSFTATSTDSRWFLGEKTKLTSGTGTLISSGASSFTFPTERGSETQTTFRTPVIPTKDPDTPPLIAETFPVSAGVGTVFSAPTEHLTAAEGTVARIRMTIVLLTDAEEKYLSAEQDGLYYEVTEKEDALTATFVETYEGRNTTYGETWKKGSIPYHAFPVYIGTYYHLIRAEAPIEKDNTYDTAIVRSTESKVLGNLLLSESITFQFYLTDDGILQSAHAKDFSCTFSEESPTEDGKIRFLVPADPKTLTGSFDLALPMTTGETYHVEISLQSYAQSVMELYADVPANIRLVKALLAYVEEVSGYFYENGKLVEEPDAEGIGRIRDLIGEDYAIPARTFDPEEISLPRGGGAILSAALNLVSNPGYAFRLNPHFTGTVTIETPTKTEIYRVTNGTWGGEEFLFAREIGAGDFRSDILVTCVGDEDDSLDMTFTYNLDSYMCGFGENIPRYALALYDYVLSVEEYELYGKPRP